MRLLLVEDESALREHIQASLQAQGAEVQSTGDGAEGLYWAQEYPFDAAVVDLGLPGLPGLELIRRLRAAEITLPILILTARDRWQEKVEGLESGADDYLTKPFEMPELIARLRALLRRAAGLTRTVWTWGPYQIDLDAQQVQCDHADISLTSFEFKLFEQLIRQRPQVLSKQKLADMLYPLDDNPDSNVIEVLIGRLRRKLDPQGAYQPIETVRGRGYRLKLDMIDAEGNKH